MKRKSQKPPREKPSTDDLLDGFGEDDRQHYELSLIHISALVEDLRDNRQVVSTVSAEDWTPSFVDGSFMIDLQTDAAKVQPAIAATLADLADVRAHGIDDASLQRAKTEMKMARLLSLIHI